MTAMENWTSSLDRLTLAGGPSQLHRGDGCFPGGDDSPGLQAGKACTRPLSQLRAS